MFPFIFGFQWQLFTAHFLCSTFSTEADVNLYFHVELPGRQLPQHCSFPGGSDRLKESFICLYSLCIWKVCFADTGPGNFFFSFNENINPADAKQWDPEFGKGFPLTVCIWAAGCVQTMGASGVPANRKGLSFRTGDKNLYFFFSLTALLINLVTRSFSVTSETFKHVCLLKLSVHSCILLWSTNCLSAFLKIFITQGHSKTKETIVNHLGQSTQDHETDTLLNHKDTGRR